MNLEEFEKRFVGKDVFIQGFNAGKDILAYRFNGRIAKAWDVGMVDGFTHKIAFKAGHHWPTIDCWREIDNAVIGFYGTTALYPDAEPGIVIIKLANDSPTGEVK